MQVTQQRCSHPAGGSSAPASTPAALCSGEISPLGLASVSTVPAGGRKSGLHTVLAIGLHACNPLHAQRSASAVQYLLLLHGVPSFTRHAPGHQFSSGPALPCCPPPALPGRTATHLSPLRVFVA